MDTKEKIKVMQAYVDGRPIQYKLNCESDWADTSIPIWNWYDCQYRIKPNKQSLTPSDFPPGTVVREKLIPGRWYAVLSVEFDRFHYHANQYQKFDSNYFEDAFEYSTDQGKTWKPCYK